MYKDFIKIISLPIALGSAFYCISALFEPSIDWYKVGFWWLLLGSNLNAYYESKR